ncbi:type III secretion system effector XopAE [Xanthomonas hortorum]|uniref:type III secretion system effector XopAE n=1 Tax=Xanthomonas hortorum TaxID=56454 RepID=UPI0029367DC2|nr:type III secretion system effector XopAE [Xanthomonas hortorum]MDV2451947.1 type III secretion system effector XopAE [Xanthomonas hortorum NBC5720]
MAERVPSGYNLHNGQRDTSREVLQGVADAIRRAGVRRSTRLALNYGLPATTLPDAIGRLEALQELSLVNTGLQSLPDSLGQLRQLRHLQVAATPGLKRLPTSLTRLPNLTTLQLTAIPLEELPADLGRMQSLRSLTLGGGRYERLPPSVVQLSQLTQLSVSHSSHLRELPESIGNMQGLKSLEVASNSKLEQLPGGLTRLHRLEELNLSSNRRLTQLPEDIGKMSGLTKLSLKDCAALRHLPDNVEDLSQLQLLDLRGTGLRTLPQSLARLPATCDIRVPDHLHGQLARIRNLQPAVEPLAGRMRPPARPAAAQARSSWNRGPEFTRVLRGIDADLGERFDRWMQGLTQNAMIFGGSMTPADMRLLDQVVAEAIMSPEFRSSFGEFLGEHTVKTLNMDGMTQVGGGGPAVRGDVKTAFSEMLKHKLMHTRDQGAALSLLQEAVLNPDLGLSRDRLLHSRNELTGRPQMWPPLRAYISMHDVEGKAAQEAATTWAMAQFDEAEEGVIGEAEAKWESEQAQANANSFIGLRARALLKEWRIQ